MKKKSWLILLFAFVLVISSACSNDSGKEPDKTDEKVDDKAGDKVEEVEVQSKSVCSLH